MKQINLLIVFSLFVTLILSCNETQKKIESTAAVVVETDNLPKEKEAVTAVMKSYKDAIQNLTTDGTFELFSPEATIFEQGKVEGTYEEYINHHLGPELGHFKSFTFSDYSIAITVNLPYAFAIENYLYTIVLKEDKSKGTSERTIESKGVATSILEKTEGEWRIIHSHTSFKKLNQ